VNNKRAERIWRDGRVQRPTSRKRKRGQTPDGSVRRHRSEHLHQVRRMVLRCDSFPDGHRPKVLQLNVKYSCRCLSIWANRSCKTKDVMALSEELNTYYQSPACIGSGKGPELIAQALRDLCEGRRNTTYITPGCSRKNEIGELFNGWFRDQCHNAKLITTEQKVQILADRWRWAYKPHRPHSVLLGRSPLEAAQQGFYV